MEPETVGALAFRMKVRLSVHSAACTTLASEFFHSNPLKGERCECMSLKDENVTIRKLEEMDCN